MDYYSILNSYNKTAYSTTNTIKKINKSLEKKSETIENNLDSKAAKAYAEREQYKIDETDRINMKVSMLAEKIKSGVELSQSELDYLEKHSKGTYQMAKEAQKVREVFLKKMRKCRTKAEVDALKLSNDLDCMDKMEAAKAAGNLGEVFKQITFKNTTQNEYNKFTSSDEYKSLPKGEIVYSVKI